MDELEVGPVGEDDERVRGGPVGVCPAWDDAAADGRVSQFREDAERRYGRDLDLRESELLERGDTS